MPRFSVLTPVYDTPRDVLEETIRSVRAQGFEDWELCLVDDCSHHEHVRASLERAQQSDSRIRVLYRDQNGGIVASSNDALAMATGEFIVLLDHDDKLHPDALAQTEAALRTAPDADYVYTDEDKIDRDGHHGNPFFKPDWSPERLRTQMYTCHLSVLRRSLVNDVGGFNPNFEGSQDWDLVLRVTERARRVIHVPRVLYHWRTLTTSAAGGGEAAKPWAFEAGTRAIQAHCDRIGFPAMAVRDVELPGVYHLQPRLSAQPTVSIIIPTGGQSREVHFKNVVLIDHCIRSIVDSSTYENYEIVCVLDAQADDSVIGHLREICGDRLSIIPYAGRFNFSSKINLGIAHSEGEHVLLLNDDMEVVTPDWIERLVMYSGLPEVGAVGGRLIWQDGRIQHVGVEFENGLPGHPYRGFSRGFNGYANSVRVARNCLAVTGACLMTRRTVFDDVGGLDESFPLNYNDMDYCLKVQAAGHRVVYDPDTVLYHFESSSRSSKVEESEKEALIDRWLPLTQVDPYSNPNMPQGAPRLRSALAWARRRPRLRGFRGSRGLV